MGNTLHRQLKSEKKKNQPSSVVSFPCTVRKHLQYVNIEGDNDSGLGRESSSSGKLGAKKLIALSGIGEEKMNKPNHFRDHEKHREHTISKDQISSQHHVQDVTHANLKPISNHVGTLNIHENYSDGRHDVSGSPAPSKTLVHDTLCMVAAEVPTSEHHSSPASSSSLWLPFRSPFRRTFFSAGNKFATQSSSNGVIGSNQLNLPMASAPRFDHPDNDAWLHQYALHHEAIKSKPQELTSLKQGDIPIDTSFVGGSFYTKSENFQHSDGSIFGEMVDKCYDIDPPLFQTTPLYVSAQYTKSNSVTFVEEATNPQKNNKGESNGSNKQGLTPIKLNRRGRNDTSRGTRELRGQEAQRITNKKQRAAHQASSPKSNASISRLGSLNRPFSRGRDTSPPPLVRMINGLKVTIIHEALKVFIVDLLTPETCDIVRRMTDDHVKQVHESGNKIATWRTLYTYTKRDLPCSEVKGLTSRVTDHIMANIIDIVGTVFKNKEEAVKLHPRSWKEPHLLLYQKFENETPHTGVEMHYDGCDITWNCMLSKSTEYDGGGTYIRAMRKTIRLEQGQVLVHPGELYHKGCDITRGERALIVCFMDGFDPHIVDSSSAQEDNELYEKNVRMY